MTIEQIIQQRIDAMETQYVSNRIEGEVDEKEFLAMLDRAKAPITNEEFAVQEVSRIYARYGIEYV